VSSDGTISINIIDIKVWLYGEYSVINRTIVLHEKEDDGGLGINNSSLLNGNSGSRIACGLIVEGIFDYSKLNFF
jgi:Cu-Zn family superoxide dismutase